MSRSNKDRSALDRGMYIAGLTALVFFVPIAVWYAAHGAGVIPNCVLHEAFGVYCPGCGGSRALEAFLKGRWITSFLYHPIVIYTAVIYVSFMVSQTIGLISRGKVRALRFRYWFLYGALAVIIVNCSVRNILKFCFDITFF